MDLALIFSGSLILILIILFLIFFIKSKKLKSSINSKDSTIKELETNQFGLSKSLTELKNKYKDIIDLDTEINKKKSEFEITQNEASTKLSETQKNLEELKQKYEKASSIYEELSKENNLLKDSLEIAEFGVCEPHFDFETSEEFKTKLLENKEAQKNAIKNEIAVVCDTQWTVDNSYKKGEMMTKRNIKLSTRAFNGECDSLIAKVKWNNVEQYEKRIRKTFEAINRLNKSNRILIKDSFLNLKIDELRLVYEYENKKYEEKEEQRRIREQMREEEKAQRDFEKAKKEAEKEEKLIQKAMKKAQEEFSKASEEEKEKYET